MTCRTVYYCGYGGYGRFSDRAALFNKADHEGHKYFNWSEDHGCCVPERHNGNLHAMGSYNTCGEMVAEGFDNYKHVDLTKLCNNHYFWPPSVHPMLRVGRCSLPLNHPEKDCLVRATLDGIEFTMRNLQNPCDGTPCIIERRPARPN